MSDPNSPSPPMAEVSASGGEWLIGGGEMGKLMRSTEWASTQLGSRESWSAAMRAVVNVVVSSPLPTALLWGRDQLVLCNDAFWAVAPGRHSFALGQAVSVVWPELWQSARAMLAAAMDRGEGACVEDRLVPVHRDDRREDAYFTISCSPVRGENGTVGGTLVILQETTKQVAERESERRFRALFERLPDATFLTVPSQGRIFAANAAACAMFGMSEEEIIRAGRDALVDTSDARLWSVVDERQRIGGYSHREVTHVRKNGERFPAESSSVILDESDKPCAFVIVRDITERKRAEAALRRSEEKFATAFSHNAAAMVVSTLAEGRILEMNESCLSLLGYKREEVIGRTAHELQTWPDPEERGRLAEALRTKGFFRDREITVRKKSGDTYIALASAATITLAGEQLVVGSSIDITDRKRTEAALKAANEQLIEADRRKNEFLAVLSHELRNPLAPIRNSVYVLEKAPPGGEQAGRARQVIDRQVQHMTRLIEDLLDVTRITRGKITLQRERVDLNVIARGTAEDHREMYARNGLSLKVEEASVPLWVDGDRTRLAQVIGNLLQNSAKFTPRGGNVVLSVKAENDRAVIRVKDTGVGMPAEAVQHIFEPFVQASQSIDRSRGGLGLGLALVRSLVEMHGGSVTAQSEGEGKGSEITVTLPLQSPVRAHLAVVRGPTAGAGARRVLVIEDNADAAESLKEALELGGREVAIAASGPEGVQLARQLRPDVVLCDIGLPGMDGYAVAHTLRADPDIRSTFLVALSGYALQEDVTRAKEAGFDGHIAKPPSVDAIEKLLAGVRPRAVAS